MDLHGSQGNPERRLYFVNFEHNQFEAKQALTGGGVIVIYSHRRPSSTLHNWRGLVDQGKYFYGGKGAILFGKTSELPDR
jgi:hypothetical protein